MEPSRDRPEPGRGPVRGGVGDDVAAAKSSLRRTLLAARAALPASEIAAARRAVAEWVLAGLTGEDATVAAYEPLRTEPGSEELLVALVGSGRRVLVPVTLPDRDLSWVEWTPAGHGPDLGRDAVAGAATVLVPALAVARADGARLGRGGGSYDRALRRTAARTVALLHRGELLATVPAEAHDVAVGAAVTLEGWWRAGR